MQTRTQRLVVSSLIATALAGCGPSSSVGDGDAGAGSGSSSRGGETGPGATDVGSTSLQTTALTTGATDAPSSSDGVGTTSEADTGSESSTGSAVLCGNGVLDEGEACDDNNTQDGDGCESTCVPTGTQWHVSPTAGLRALAVDLDDNVLVAGTTVDLDDQDLWLGKYTPFGDEIWTRTIAGAAVQTDRAHGIAVNAQGEVIVAGYLFEGAAPQPIVASFDPDGTPAWTQTWTAGVNAQASGVGVDSEGHVVVSGTTWTQEAVLTIHGWVRRHNADGTLLWSADLAEPGQFPTAVAGGPQGTLGVVGNQDGPLDRGWVRVLDLDGQSLWEGIIDGGGPPAVHRVFDVVHTAEGYYVAVGDSAPSGDPYDRSVALWCFDATGFVECGAPVIELDQVGTGLGVAHSPPATLGVVGRVGPPSDGGRLWTFDIGANGSWPSLGEFEFPFASWHARAIAYDSTGAAIVANGYAFWKVAQP